VVVCSAIGEGCAVCRNWAGQTFFTYQSFIQTLRGEEEEEEEGTRFDFCPTTWQQTLNEK
jgi:hypothetical protein